MDLRELALSDALANRHPWELARADAVAYLAQRVLRTQPAGASVLDVGCGDAFLVDTLVRRLGLKNAYAVDAAFNSRVRSQIARQVSPQVQLYSSVRDWESAQPDPANLVLLLDVLEHCEADLAELQRIVQSDAVAPGAAFILTVPAFQGLYSQHDRFLGHYRRYRLSEFSRLAQSAGLEIQSRSYFFSSLLLPRGLQVGMEKMGWGRSDRRGLAAYRGGQALTTAIRMALWADFRICDSLARAGVRLPGLSCYVLGTKPKSNA